MRLAAVCAVLLLVGCASSTDRGSGHGALTDDELHWVRSYVGWRQDFDASSAEGGRRALASCARSLESRVSDAPTARLEPVARLARGACRDYEATERYAKRFFDAHDFDAGPKMQAAESHGDRKADLAFTRLERLLWESRRLPRVAGGSARSREQSRYAEVAHLLTSRDLDIRCWNGTDWQRVQREAAAFQDVASVDVDGFANFYTGHVNLSPQVCSALDELTYGEDRPTASDALDRLAYGAFVLAHETDHIVGVDDEAIATCDGLQNIERVARALGADDAYARKLADAYWDDLYPQEPPAYRTIACGPNRPLDRTPGDGRWP